MKNYKDEPRYEDRYGFEIVIVDPKENDRIIGFWIKSDHFGWNAQYAYPVTPYSRFDVETQLDSHELKQVLKQNGYVVKIVEVNMEFQFFNYEDFRIE